MEFDVAIVGGGPSGSTLGSMLKRYDPSLKVGIFERESFPREHVRESLLQAACHVCHEIGAWDKIEAERFPIKIGAVYRWGRSDETFALNFTPEADLVGSVRPGKFEGPRTKTAWQVDRGIFDKLLLDHASELGCEVFENTKITRVARTADQVDHLEFIRQDGSTGQVVADHYVDCSGSSGLFRRAFEVEVDAPTALRNIAIWDYWQDCEWTTEIGEDVTRIQIMSLGWGWIWFISIGITRTSIGLVVPVEYFKRSGMTTEEIYLKAIQEEATNSKLIEPGRREGKLSADKDWSYISQRFYGDNWFLCGDASGFADPILSAGISLALAGSRRLAYSILEMRRGSLDANWIKSEYERVQQRNIRNHIQFCDYWYSANAMFTDLFDFCGEIAKSAGLSLTPDEAWRWLGTGGFTEDVQPGIHPTFGTYTVDEVKSIVHRFTGTRPDWKFARAKELRLDLSGAERVKVATYTPGAIKPVEAYVRGSNILMVSGYHKLAITALASGKTPATVGNYMVSAMCRKYNYPPKDSNLITNEVLESMLHGGWIIADYV